MLDTQEILLSLFTRLLLLLSKCPILRNQYLGEIFYSKGEGESLNEIFRVIELSHSFWVV